MANVIHEEKIVEETGGQKSGFSRRAKHLKGLNPGSIERRSGTPNRDQLGFSYS